ncbi:MAG TPA: DUF2877 domain-containing protein [Xanthobacteraceae bacterium]|nr:DUF2877 domain-containing protein [Xanthobacteraceae bacterium]
MLAQAFCRNTARATVEAVFDRSFYLRSGDDFICVGEPEIGNGPLTLIGRLGALPDMRPRQPAEVSERRILIDGRIRLSLDGSETWRAPRWLAGPSPDRLIETCATLAQRAAIDAPEAGFARLPQIARARIARFERWLSDVLAGHAGSASDAVGLLGLGPGLTPSGDDVLAGALAALDAIGERDAHAALARAIVDTLPGTTSPLSACLLRAAAAGQIGESLYRAVSAAIAGDVDAAIAAAEAIGHSSGWDMLAGVTTALRVAARRPHAGALS